MPGDGGEGPLDGENQLQQRADIAIFGAIDIGDPVPGNYVYTVRLTDVRGNVATVEGSFTIEQCIG